jgi:hypothetical protein
MTSRFLQSEWEMDEGENQNPAALADDVRTTQQRYQWARFNTQLRKIRNDLWLCFNGSQLPRSVKVELGEIPSQRWICSRLVWLFNYTITGTYVHAHIETCRRHLYERVCITNRHCQEMKKIETLWIPTTFETVLKLRYGGQTKILIVTAETHHRFSSSLAVAGYM